MSLHGKETSANSGEKLEKEAGKEAIQTKKQLRNLISHFSLQKALDIFQRRMEDSLERLTGIERIMGRHYHVVHPHKHMAFEDCL